MVVLKGTWAVALLLLFAICVHSQDIIQNPNVLDKLVTQDFGCDITSSKAQYSYAEIASIRNNINGYRAPIYPSACFPTKTPGPGQTNTILAPFSGWNTVYLNSAFDYPTVNLANLYKQAKPAFVSVATIDNSRGGSPLTQSLTYTKTTTNTFQWTLTESLQVGAKLGLKAGLPGLGEVSTEISITGTLGSSQQWSSTNTESFTSTLSVTVQPGKCSVVVGATQYVSEVAIPFIFRNSVICTYQASAAPLYSGTPLSLWDPYVNTQSTSNYTCSDVNSQTRLAGILGNSNFKGKLFPPTDGSNVSKTTNTGTFQVNFGVTATLTGCDCDDAACYETATGISPTSTTLIGQEESFQGDEDPTDPINGDPFGFCLDCLTINNGTTLTATPSNEEGSGTNPPPAPTATPIKGQGIGEQIAKKIGDITQAIDENLPFSAYVPAPGPGLSSALKP